MSRPRKSSSPRASSPGLQTTNASDSGAAESAATRRASTEGGVERQESMSRPRKSSSGVEGSPGMQSSNANAASEWAAKRRASIEAAQVKRENQLLGKVTSNHTFKPTLVASTPRRPHSPAQSQTSGLSQPSKRATSSNSRSASPRSAAPKGISPKPRTQEKMRSSQSSTAVAGMRSTPDAAGVRSTPSKPDAGLSLAATASRAVSGRSRVRGAASIPGPAFADRKSCEMHYPEEGELSTGTSRANDSIGTGLCTPAFGFGCEGQPDAMSETSLYGNGFPQIRSETVLEVLEDEENESRNSDPALAMQPTPTFRQTRSEAALEPIAHGAAGHWNSYHDSRGSPDEFSVGEVPLAEATYFDAYADHNEHSVNRPEDWDRANPEAITLGDGRFAGGKMRAMDHINLGNEMDAASHQAERAEVVIYKPKATSADSSVEYGDARHSMLGSTEVELGNDHSPRDTLPSCEERAVLESCARAILEAMANERCPSNSDELLSDSILQEVAPHSMSTDSLPRHTKLHDSPVDHREQAAACFSWLDVSAGSASPEPGPCRASPDRGSHIDSFEQILAGARGKSYLYQSPQSCTGVNHGGPTYGEPLADHFGGASPVPKTNEILLPRECLAAQDAYKLASMPSTPCPLASDVGNLPNWSVVSDVLAPSPQVLIRDGPPWMGANSPQEPDAEPGRCCSPVAESFMGCSPGLASTSAYSIGRGAQGMNVSVSSSGSSGLVIGFRLACGSERLIEFAARKPPLGMDFTTRAPIAVKRIKPGGHAADLGVEVGWLLVSCNGEVLEGLDCREAFDRLSYAAALAAADGGPSSSSKAVECQTATAFEGYKGNLSTMNWPADRLRDTSLVMSDGQSGFVLGFRLPDGNIIRVGFGGVTPPLGMDFENQTPVLVTGVQPHSPAEKSGVRVGWEVVSINEKDVEGMNFLHVFRLMKIESEATET